MKEHGATPGGGGIIGNVPKSCERPFDARESMGRLPALVRGIKLAGQLTEIFFFLT
jgi:hypothetical protein